MLKSVKPERKHLRDAQIIVLPSELMNRRNVFSSKNYKVKSYISNQQKIRVNDNGSQLIVIWQQQKLQKIDRFSTAS